MALRPGSLPPSAILCVRELHDPLPRTVSLESHQLRPPPAWEGAMQREVDRLARDATWPARGAVPAGAEAVVFADHAELLACLGSDLLTGMIAARWWWRLLVEGVEQPRRAVVRAWQQAPEHVPAALQALAERGQASAFVRILDDREARRLTDAIGRRFALPTVTLAADTVRASPPATASAARIPRPVAPWIAIVPEAEQAELSTEQRVLVGVALTVARAPSLARSADFVTALAAWRIAVAAPEPSSGPPVPAHAPPIAQASSRTESASTIPPDGAPQRRSPRPGGDLVSVAVVASTNVGSLPAAPAMGVNDETQPPIAPDAQPPPPLRPLHAAPPLSPSLALVDTAAPAADTASHASEEMAAYEPVLAADLNDPEAIAKTPHWSAPPHKLLPPRPRNRALGPPIATELGGLFYLVNLALYLRLYSDGDEGGDNLALPLWDFVALVGRELLGDSVIADDPVWSLLAEAAGRAPDDPPGAGFVPPADWRLPPAWLAASAPAPLRDWTSDGRLVIAHAEGFLLVDVEASGDRDAQLARELAPYGELTCAPGAGEAAPPLLPGTPLECWLTRLLPYLRARLRGILAVDDAGLPAVLIAHPARVHVTDTHVDVVLSLETLPIEIRCAGLDRDPGWVAAAGRFIAFHFE